MSATLPCRVSAAADPVWQCNRGLVQQDAALRQSAANPHLVCGDGVRCTCGYECRSVHVRALNPYASFDFVAHNPTFSTNPNWAGLHTTPRGRKISKNVTCSTLVLAGITLLRGRDEGAVSMQPTRSRWASLRPSGCRSSSRLVERLAGRFGLLYQWPGKADSPAPQPVRAVHLHQQRLP